VTVEDIVGNDSIDGTLAVAHAAPDGHTLLIVPSQFTWHPRQKKNLPYDVVEDFAPALLMALGPNLLVAHPSLPFKSVAELVAHAKAHPRTLKCASAGKASASHRAAELFERMAKVEFSYVYFDGAAPATESLLKGETDILFSVMAPTIPHVKAGRVRALAVTGAKRSTSNPEIPSIAEAGFQGYDVTTWQGLFAPAGTPREIILKLNADVTRVLAMPEVQQVLAKLGFELAGGTPEELAERITREVAGN
jgi:tripartite-type tricarboxylate transporter receptor subunit TctC